MTHGQPRRLVGKEANGGEAPDFIAASSAMAHLHAVHPVWVSVAPTIDRMPVRVDEREEPPEGKHRGDRQYKPAGWIHGQDDRDLQG